jgi:hypothetical protein
MASALRFGLIGSGYMGRAYAIDLLAVAATFGADYRAECSLPAEHSLSQARAAAAVNQAVHG